MSANQITLPPDLAEKVEERIASGASEDAVGVMREALAALEAEDQRKLDRVREKVRQALADPRPSLQADDVFDEVDAMLSKLSAR